MPIIAQRGLVVITRDRLANKAEWEAFQEHGIRAFRLAARGEQSIWRTVQLLAGSWERMEGFVREAGPGPWLAILDSAGAITRRF